MCDVHFFLSSSAIVLLTSNLVATIDLFILTPFATPLNAIFGAISSDILMAPFVGLFALFPATTFEVIFVIFRAASVFITTKFLLMFWVIFVFVMS